MGYSEERDRHGSWRKRISIFFSPSRASTLMKRVVWVPKKLWMHISPVGLLYSDLPDRFRSLFKSTRDFPGATFWGLGRRGNSFSVFHVPSLQSKPWAWGEVAVLGAHAVNLRVILMFEQYSFWVFLNCLVGFPASKAKFKAQSKSTEWWPRGRLRSRRLNRHQVFSLRHMAFPERCS